MFSNGSSEMTVMHIVVVVSFMYVVRIDSPGYVQIFKEPEPKP